MQPLDFGSVSKIQLKCQALGDEPMRGIILYMFNTENHEQMSKVATCRVELEETFQAGDIVSSPSKIVRGVTTSLRQFQLKSRFWSIFDELTWVYLFMKIHRKIHKTAALKKLIKIFLVMFVSVNFPLKSMEQSNLSCSGHVPPIFILLAILLSSLVVGWLFCDNFQR